MKLKKTDHPALTAAIAQAEQKTSAEIVVVVEPQSGSWADAVGVVAGACALLSLAFIVFSDVEFDPFHVVPTALALAVAGGALASMLLPHPAFMKARQIRQIDEAAHAAFSRLGVYTTSGRTGVLVYLSLAERTGRVLFDVGAAQAIPADVRHAWRVRVNEVTDAAGLVALIGEIGERAGQVLPRAADDKNELGDGVNAA